MTPNDLDRLANIEQRIMQGQSIHFIRDIPGFPYSSLSELRAAIDSQEITIGALYDADLLWSLGTRSEILAQCFWMTWLPLICIAYVVAAVVSGRWLFLFGTLATCLGILLAAPFLKKTASPFVGLGWIFCICFAFVRPIWAWDIAGFYGGYVFTATAQLQLTMAVVERALRSEIIFCYLYFRHSITLKDKNNNIL